MNLLLGEKSRKPNETRMRLERQKTARGWQDESLAPPPRLVVARSERGRLTNLYCFIGQSLLFCWPISIVLLANLYCFIGQSLLFCWPISIVLLANLYGFIGQSLLFYWTISIVLLVNLPLA